MAPRTRLAPRYPGAETAEQLRARIAASPEYAQLVGEPAPSQDNSPAPLAPPIPTQPTPAASAPPLTPLQTTELPRPPAPTPAPAPVTPAAPAVPATATQPAPAYVPPAPPPTGGLAENPLGMPTSADVELMLLREQLAVRDRERAAEQARVRQQEEENAQLRREVEEAAAARRNAERQLEQERRLEQLRNFRPPELSRFSPEDVAEIQNGLIAPQLKALMDQHAEEIRQLRESATSAQPLTPEQIEQQLARSTLQLKLQLVEQQVIRDNPDFPQLLQTPEWRVYINQRVGPAQQQLRTFLEEAERNGNHAYINSVIDTFRKSIQPPSDDVLVEPTAANTAPVVASIAPDNDKSETMSYVEYSDMANKRRSRVIDEATWQEFNARFEKAKAEGRVV